ncbi:MAG: hypothetical protein RI554_09145, partial [Trueperaceae bacterium]|nr:hypothetical protein [Trueperaceae bacterium]
MVLAAALLLGACSPNNAPRGYVVDAVTPAIADVGATVTLTGRLPGGGAVHACEHPLEGLVVSTDPDAAPSDVDAWLSATDAAPNRAYPAARAVVPAELRGATCLLTLVDADGVHYPSDVGGEGGDVVAAPTLAVRATVPAAISGVSVTDGDAHAVLAFDAPDPGGRPILRYEVRVSPSDAWRTPSPSDAAALVVDGLTNGVTYPEAHVRAVNAVGPGPAGTPFVLAPFGPADPPGEFDVTVGDGRATLHFAPPDPNGRPVTHYQVRVNDGPWTDVPLEEAGPPLVVEGLANGVPHVLAVRAVTAAGPGATATVEDVTPGPPPPPSTPVQVGAGGHHAFAVDPQGRTWAWGSNGHRQLGDGTDDPHEAPIHVTTVPTGRWRHADGGVDHAHLVDAEGRVWSWGDNVDGRLGTGDTLDRREPVVLSALDAHVIRTLDTGGKNTLAVDAEGGLWRWGALNAINFGTRELTPVPVDALSPVDVRGVGVGTDHAVVVDADGGVWAWGENRDGRVGTGSTTDVPVPVSLTDAFPRPVTAVAAGAMHSLALDDAGRVWAWGAGADGRLGTGSTTDVHAPARVEGFGGRRIVALDAGRAFSVALDDEGDVWAWGDAAFGQLGQGNTDDAHRPVRVGGLPAPVVRIATGLTHVLAADGNDAVWAWGANDRNQAGGTGDVQATPVRVPLR